MIRHGANRRGTATAIPREDRTHQERKVPLDGKVAFATGFGRAPPVHMSGILRVEWINDWDAACFKAAVAPKPEGDEHGEG